MANDDRQSQLFIREVDEELRREQLQSIWDRFAPLIIGACILVVALTAGYRGWEWWRTRQAAEAGDRFTAALQAIESGKRAEGEAQLTQIAAAGDGGYATLARLRLAGEKAAAGAKPEALAAYDALAADAAVTQSMRSLARLRAALLALDAGDLAGARERAAPLDQPGGSWRHAAREVRGVAAYQAGELQQARDAFAQIQQDAETPPDLWTRSGMMLSVIDGTLPAPGITPPPAPDSAAPPPDAAAPPAVAPPGPDAAAAPTPDAAAPEAAPPPPAAPPVPAAPSAAPPQVEPPKAPPQSPAPQSPAPQSPAPQSSAPLAPPVDAASPVLVPPAPPPASPPTAPAIPPAIPPQ